MNRTNLSLDADALGKVRTIAGSLGAPLTRVAEVVLLTMGPRLTREQLGLLAHRDEQFRKLNLEARKRSQPNKLRKWGVP